MALQIFLDHGQMGRTPHILSQAAHLDLKAPIVTAHAPPVQLALHLRDLLVETGPLLALPPVKAPPLFLQDSQLLPQSLASVRILRFQPLPQPSCPAQIPLDLPERPLISRVAQEVLLTTRQFFPPGFHLSKLCQGYLFRPLLLLFEPPFIKPILHPICQLSQPQLSLFPTLVGLKERLAYLGRLAPERAMLDEALGVFILGVFTYNLSQSLKLGGQLLPEYLHKAGLQPLHFFQTAFELFQFSSSDLCLPR